MRLEAKNISVTRGSRVIFDQVSLVVDAGEIVALRGPNGCGKTTLLRALVGLLPVTHGEVLFGGMLVNGRGKVRLPEPGSVGFAFQDGGLWPHMRADRHLDFVLRQNTRDAAERRDRVAAMLDIFRLTARSRKRPHELSGGEQQRLSLARALIARPRVLLLDEAFVHLDVETREIAADQVCQQAADGAAVIATAHGVLPFQADTTLAFTDAGRVARV